MKKVDLHLHATLWNIPKMGKMHFSSAEKMIPHLKELGIRKALGAPPSIVMWSVVGESLAITSIFGFIGVLLGSGVVSLIGAIMSKTKNAVFVNPSVDAWAVIVATLILIVIGVVAGAIPAYRAMRIKPIEAMNADK